MNANDEVVLNPAGFGARPSLHTIRRVTPTGLLVIRTWPTKEKHIDRYFYPDGWERGSHGCRRAHIEPATEELRNKIKNNEDTEFLNSIKWESLPPAVVSKAVEVVRNFNQKGYVE